MSPSATRAAFMFTVYLTGLLIMRKAQILNILGFTAIFLLVREPFLLHNLGFQFSFLALTGIVIWGMPLLRAISFRYRIFQYAWSIIAISLGAQILVAPAILYYFNEISVVSPVTSLVAIPAAYIIVFGGIILLTLEMISPIAGIFLGKILSYSIHLINQFFTGFSHVSFSTINDIYINSVEVAILACVIILASLWLLTDRSVWLNATVPFSLLFAIFHCPAYLQKTSSPHLTIYASKSELALDVISTGVTQSTLDPDESEYFTLQAARRNRLQHYASTTIQIRGSPKLTEPSVFSITLSTDDSGACHVLYIGSELVSYDFPTGQFSCIVLAKSLDYRTSRRLIAQCNLQNVKVHDMRKQGAFNLSLL